jgi:hypothetical protein
LRGGYNYKFSSSRTWQLNHPYRLW